ncbi:hypothetical protein [Ramlibacter humi]|uniref:Uncharacterized protein n=1 Tax=Ramlibacter humi TaxID=2530451 RepID=A0A4Z0BFU8_9BURK|nr:hypothetical protein [Ramlibacter humi]TFY97167.1 hypothetical protein EZ216_18990 [Ramlibacter humi]
MQLDFLIFESSDDGAGTCSFEALASAVPARLPALIREVDAVLGWAAGDFGPPSAGASDGEWDFDLQAWSGDDAPLAITCDVQAARVSLLRVPDGRVTIALILTGSSAFGDAFSAAFTYA